MARPIKIVLAVAAAAALLAGLASAAVVMSPALQDRVFAIAARTQLQRASQMPTGRDALHVLLCGTSSPMPNRASAKSCTLVAAGGRVFLVDIGPESTENLGLWRVPMPQVEAVFVTHFHSDHIGELGEFNMQGWAQGRRTPLTVYGGDGIEGVVGGFNAAYAPDRQYRHAHHDRGRGLLPLAAGEMIARSITLPPPGRDGVRSTVVYSRDGVTVTAIEASHEPVKPALSYRFDYKGRSVLITGDTVYHKPLVAAARGVDLFVSEALSPHLQGLIAGQAEAVGQTGLGSVLRDTLDYHVSPVDAARMANEAGARVLLYTHIAPALPNRLVRRAWLRGVDEVRPDGVRVGEDGLVASIPVDGAPIRWTRLKG